MASAVVSRAFFNGELDESGGHGAQKRKKEEGFDAFHFLCGEEYQQ